jgi:NAD(P)-dependent dehydrogenase (short-subunit alcohol dehydrogenase family)
LNIESVCKLFSLDDDVAVVTGGSGVLCSAIAMGFARAGARVVLLNRNVDNAYPIVEKIQESGGTAMACSCDVTDRKSVEDAFNKVMDRFKRVDILVNGAGGNHPDAIASPKKRFFEIPPEAMTWVTQLNLVGTILPCQVFGEQMAQQNEGVILNISSMSAYRPLTRVAAYGAAKAAVSNFTQWLAVHLAQEYSAKIRVNALAPGFYLGNQNRALLIDEKTGNLTPRGKAILAHTPMARFGNPEDLVGTALWLVSPASAFVTGVVVPVDGGFNAFGGV